MTDNKNFYYVGGVALHRATLALPVKFYILVHLLSVSCMTWKPLALYAPFKKNTGVDFAKIAISITGDFRYLIDKAVLKAIKSMS